MAGCGGRGGMRSELGRHAPKNSLVRSFRFGCTLTVNTVLAFTTDYYYPLSARKNAHTRGGGLFGPGSDRTITSTEFRCTKLLSGGHEIPRNVQPRNCRLRMHDTRVPGTRGPHMFESPIS
eukprot:2673368-Rhodomonas_salina.1